MEYTQARILLSLKRERNPVTCYNRDGPGRRYVSGVEISQSHRDKYWMIYLHDASRVVQIPETESRGAVTGVRGEE